MKTSAQWKQERDVGLATTDCLIALIPRNKSEDISINLTVGHKKGLELINTLQPEEEVELSLTGVQTEIGRHQHPPLQLSVDNILNTGI